MRALLILAKNSSYDAYLNHGDTLEKCRGLTAFQFPMESCWIKRADHHVIMHQEEGEEERYSIVAVNRVKRIAFGILCNKAWMNEEGYLPQDKLLPVFSALVFLMEGASEEEEEEEELFVPDQKIMEDLMEKETKELDRLQKLRTKQQKDLIAARKHLEALRYEKQLIDGSKEGFGLYIERQRSRRQPIWWAFLVLVSLVFFLGQWDIGRRASSIFNYHMLLAFMNLAAHKLLWRRMYVNVNTTSQFVAVIILFYTFWMG